VGERNHISKNEERGQKETGRKKRSKAKERKKKLQEIA